MGSLIHYGLELCMVHTRARLPRPRHSTERLHLYKPLPAGTFGV